MLLIRSTQGVLVLYVEVYRNALVDKSHAFPLIVAVHDPRNSRVGKNWNHKLTFGETTGYRYRYRYQLSHGSSSNETLLQPRSNSMLINYSCFMKNPTKFLNVNCTTKKSHVAKF